MTKFQGKEEIFAVTTHTHESGELIRCCRCNKAIKEMATYHVYRCMVVGPECVESAKEECKGIKGLSNCQKATREKFLAKKREDTIKGMKAKGLL